MHDLRNTCNYKDLQLRGTHWCIKYLTEKIYNDCNNVVLCQNFTSCQGSMRTFSKHYSKCKRVSIKFRKTLQKRILLILKSSQDNPQNNFLNFLSSKNISITLKNSRDILGIFLKQTFIECPSNILETLLRDYWNLPKDQHLLLSNYTLLTKPACWLGKLCFLTHFILTLEFF